MPRVFLMKERDSDVTLSDPNEAWSAEAVLQFYANTYPILTTAKISGPLITGDTIEYRFESVMGTKG
jgi:PRTRC genetic system protein C